jgi:hypothetical protein
LGSTFVSYKLRRSSHVALPTKPFNRTKIPNSTCCNYNLGNSSLRDLSDFLKPISLLLVYWRESLFTRKNSEFLTRSVSSFIWFRAIYRWRMEISSRVGKPMCWKLSAVEKITILSHRRSHESQNEFWVLQNIYTYVPQISR